MLLCETFWALSQFWKYFTNENRISVQNHSIYQKNSLDLTVCDAGWFIWLRFIIMVWNIFHSFTRNSLDNVGSDCSILITIIIIIEKYDFFKTIKEKMYKYCHIREIVF